MKYVSRRAGAGIVLLVGMLCVAAAAVAIYLILKTGGAPSNRPPAIAPAATGTAPEGNIAQKPVTPPSGTTSTAASASSSAAIRRPSKPVANAIAPPVTVPVQTAPASVPNSVPAAPAPKLPPEVSVDPQAIVGILCYSRATYTNPTTGKSITDDQLSEARGSGVFISKEGYILTNRHVVQEPTETTTISDANGSPVSITVAYELDHCEVGQLPKGTYLPTADQIRSLNPFIQVPVLGYVAEPVFVSPTAGRSAIEIDAADFAILKITGVSSSGPTFGVTSVPTSFPYAKLLPVASYDPTGEQVVTYGFPGDVTAGQQNSFETLTLTGSVGRITQIEVGNVYYANTPLIITSAMEISQGRSGSPLFWRGYVIGIVTFYIGNDRTNSGSVASDAILKALQGTGYYAG